VAVVSRPSATPTTLVRRTFATLRSLRYVAYLGGLAVVTLASTVAPAWTRTPLVVAALIVMCTTYLAELHGRAGSVRSETVVTAVAVAGIAVGAFVLVEANRVGGLLFLLGGVFFFRVAIRSEDDDD
jgi:hypothetical protein